MLNLNIVKTIRHNIYNRELSKASPSDLDNLYSEVIKVFYCWKDEQTDKEAIKGKGGLAKSIPFEEAEPWQCAELINPTRISFAIKLWNEGYQPFINLCDRSSLKHIFGLLIINEPEDYRGDDMFYAYDIVMRSKEIKSKAQFMFYEPLIEFAKKSHKNLKNGRTKATKTNIERGAINRAWYEKAIHDLLSHSSNPAKSMENEEIAQWIHNRNNTLKVSTIKEFVKPIAAKYRKKLTGQQIT
jgi:hypothetical protein